MNINYLWIMTITPYRSAILILLSFDLTPLNLRLSFCFSDSLVLNIFLLPLSVRINLLVKAKTTGSSYFLLKIVLLRVC